MRLGDDDRRRLMHEGLGLNVNLPAFADRSGPTLPFKVTQIGVATAFGSAFFQRLSDSALAVACGVGVPLPGVGLTSGGTALPSGTVVPLDTDARSEGNVVAQGGAAP